MRWLLLGAIAAALVTGAAAAHASPPVDGPGSLSAALDLLERAEQAAPAQREVLAAAALRALDDPDLPARRWLQAPLQASPPNVLQAKSRVIAVRSSLNVPVSSDLDAQVAQVHLGQLLDAPPFKQADWIDSLPEWLQPISRTIRSLYQRVLDLARWPLDRLLDALLWLWQGVRQGPLALGLGLLAAAAIVFVYRQALRSAIVADAETQVEGRLSRLTAAEALAVAREHASAGHYREACHFVLLATLLGLEERGIARFDPSATNREHLALVAGQPALAGALEPMITRFDGVWYRTGDPTAGDYEVLVALAERARQAVA